MKIEDLFRKEAIIAKQKKHGETIDFSNRYLKSQLTLVFIGLVALLYLLFFVKSKTDYIKISNVTQYSETNLSVQFERSPDNIMNTNVARLITPEGFWYKKDKVTIILNDETGSIIIESEFPLDCSNGCYLEIERSKDETILGKLF